MSRTLFSRLSERFRPDQHNPMTRREMLRATAAASAGLLLSHAPGAFARARGGKRVVVIGAGFAGLACAHELRAAGYDVTVVEARDRVGGRVLSFGDFVPGRNMEGGAELIGSNHPTWVSYAEKFKLEFLDVTEDPELSFGVIIDGKRLTDDEVAKLYEEFEASLTTVNKAAEPIDADEPWTSPDAAALDKRTVADWIKGLTDISETTRKAIAIEFAADNAAATDRLSWLGMLTVVKGGGLDKYWTDSEVYRCKGGNQQLAARLADAIGRDQINLNLPVTDISARGKTVIVTCGDGRVIECDDVVLAAPPTVWSKIRMTPPLPDAIKPQMGVAIKYLMHMKSRFWKADGLAPDCLMDGPVTMTWEGTDNQEGDAPAGLVAFSGGPAAAACLEFPRDKRDERFREEIQKIYANYGDNFVASRFMDWPREKWTMTGYSFPAPGQVTTVGPLLQKGFGPIHFAGEHTCYKFVGYMEGALNSGVTLARRLAKRDGAKMG